MTARLIAAFIALTLLIACSAQSRPEGYVYMRIADNPTTLDPALIVDVTGGLIAAKLFSGLVRLGPDLAIAPDIAQSWTVSGDGLRYRFKLRRGVKFHSGRELKAEDVRYSFERVLHPDTKSPKTWVLRMIAGASEYMAGRADMVRGIRVLDAYTVELTLSEPYSPFLYLLTMPAGYIVPVEEVLRWGDDFSAHVVGTGPFKLELWQQNRDIKLSRNEAYFDGRAMISGMVYRVIPEELTAVAEFELGNIDLLLVPPAEFQRYSRADKWKGLLSSQDGINTFYMGMNCARAPFDDPDLRRAVSHAIDRARILRTVQEGRGRLASGPLPEQLRKWAAPVPYAFDMAEARRIIKAKHAEGMKVRFYITADQQVVDMAEVIQSYLKDAGLDVSIVQLEWSGFKAAVTNGEADMFWLSWWADYPDPENFLYPLFHSANHGSGGNRVRYSNPKVDALIIKGQQATSDTLKNSSYAEAERMVVHDAPWVFMWHRTDYVVRQPRITKFTLNPVYTMDKGMDIAL